MPERETEITGQTFEIPQLGQEIVVFTGLEGSGKSRISRDFAAITDKPYIYTGDILRNLAVNDPGPLGDACRQMFEEHTYLDPQLLLQILKDRLSHKNTEEGFILDGGLRTTEETVGFQDMLSEIDRSMPITVVNLRIPAWEGYKRLSNRGRADDTHDGIMQRFRNYYHELGQRTSFMRNQEGFRFIQVDGTGPIEDVFARTCGALQ